MKGIAFCRAVLSFACCLLAAGCYSTYRVRPGLDDLYIYAPGQEERSFELERELPYAPGAEGRRLRVSDVGRSLEVWIGPLRVSGKAQVAVRVRPGGYQGSPETVAGNFRQFWDDHKAELEGTLGAAAKKELEDALLGELKPGRLPRSATETLAASFRLKHHELPGGTVDQGTAQIDLLPGMRLRIEEAMFQRMPSGADVFETGYMSVGTNYYYVTQRPDEKISFEPFLGRLDQMGAAPEIQRGPSPGGLDTWYLIGSVVDLSDKVKEFRRYRLFFPKSFTNSHLDRFDPCDRIVLVGADSEAGLKWRCGNKLDTEEKDGCTPPEQTCRFVSRFRGRTLVVPEFAVSVNGEAVWVSAGATLRNVAEPFRDLSTDIGRRSVKLSRRSAEGRYAWVDLTSAKRGGIDPIDLPLLPGDRIVLSGGY